MAKKSKFRKSLNQPNVGGYVRISRKTRRKDERKMVKVRKLANSMKKTVTEVIDHHYKPVAMSEQETARAQAKLERKEAKRQQKELEVEKEESDDEPEAVSNLTEDDRAIKYFERKLGYNRRKPKGIPNVFKEMGLDYILEVCDLGDKNDEIPVEKPKKSGKGEFKSEQIGEDFEMEDMEDLDETETNEMSDDQEEENDEKEDIYGRIDGEINTEESNKRMEILNEMKDRDENREDILRMTKLLRGILNRLSEGSLVNAVKTMENIFASHRHSDVKQCLTNGVLSSICVGVLLPSKLTIIYATLIAALHSIVSPSISAHLVEECTIRLRAHFNETKYNVDDKTFANLLTFMCFLHNLKVVDSILMLEVLDVMQKDFSERSIAMILLVMTHTGFSIRKSNPLGLKMFIEEIHTKASSQDVESMKEKSNIRFMLETVMAVKNNNMPKVTDYDPSLLEHTNKILKGLRKGKNVEDPLPMGLHDLWEAEVKGRWWVVGSAWNPKITGPSVSATNSNEGKQSIYSEELVSLAKKHRMNTQIRVNIFCTIMSSKDCEDCLQNVLTLGLRGTKEREIVHVTMICALKQKSFNPFYAVFLHRLAEQHKRFKLTIQYAIWDKVNQLSELKIVQQQNLSAIIASLLLSQTVNLTVFKVIRFAELDKITSTLMRQTLSKLLSKCAEEQLKKMASVTAASEKNFLLVEGLQLFVQHAFLHKKPAHKLQKQAEMFDAALSPNAIAAL